MRPSLMLLLLGEEVAMVTRAELAEHFASLRRAPEVLLAERIAREHVPTVTVSTGAALSELVLAVETGASLPWWIDRPEPRRELCFAPLPSPSQRSAWRARDRAAGRRRPGR